jgi:hypothetical protein
VARTSIPATQQGAFSCAAPRNASRGSGYGWSGRHRTVLAVSRQRTLGTAIERKNQWKYRCAAPLARLHCYQTARADDEQQRRGLIERRLAHKPFLRVHGGPPRDTALLRSQRWAAMFPWRNPCQRSQRNHSTSAHRHPNSRQVGRASSPWRLLPKRSTIMGYLGSTNGVQNDIIAAFGYT